jgi:thiol-disulfide isomerase/thioredoxin
VCAVLFTAQSALAYPQTPSRSKTHFQVEKSQASTAKKGEEADAALAKAVREAGNDQVAMVRKLQAYLIQFPDGPRNAAVYRALVEGCQQLRDDACALESAEKLIALHPEDSDMMLVAVHLLEEGNDEHGLTRASGYLTRIIDRVEKTPPDPGGSEGNSAGGAAGGAGENVAWQATQDKLRAVLYATRGRIEERQKLWTDATKDFNASDKIIHSSMAEEHLGAIAEMQRDLPEAIRHYLTAFVLPEESPAGTVDRTAIRQNLGNVWRQLHGTDAGLADAILGEFDHTETYPTAGKVLPRNRDARDVFGFTLRDLEGKQTIMSLQRGKTVVLSFWATWCEPCGELEPLFARVANEYEGRNDVVFFAVDTDTNEAVVKPFVSARGWTVPVVFADGLDEFLRVLTLPTVIIVDRSGKIDYRANGYQSEDFVERLTAAIEKVSRH